MNLPLNSTHWRCQTLPPPIACLRECTLSNPWERQNPSFTFGGLGQTTVQIRTNLILPSGILESMYWRTEPVRCWKAKGCCGWTSERGRPVYNEMRMKWLGRRGRPGSLYKGWGWLCTLPDFPKPGYRPRRSARDAAVFTVSPWLEPVWVGFVPGDQWKIKKWWKIGGLWVSLVTPMVKNLPAM